MTDRLAQICAVKRDHVAARKAALSPAEIADRIAAAGPPRNFRAALAARVAAGRPALIAEIKRASPSKGLIRADFDPPAHARAYAAAGAACLSVLTDIPFFQGDDAFLEQARAAVPLPALRKDFMVDPWQVGEARALGADAILIIVAALDDATMAAIEAAAIDHDLDVLVEVHDRAELDRALALKSRLIGINSRNLRDFSVDLARTAAIAAHAPADALIVAESGITGPADIARLAADGIGCYLVGESLMRQPDIEAATRTLLSA